MSTGRASLFVVAIAAALLDIGALVLGADGSWLGYLIAVTVHLLATELVRHRVHSVCGDGASGTLAVLGTFAVPVFGAFLATTLHVPEEAGSADRASRILEEYDAFVHYREEPHRPSPFTGNFQEDLVTFASVESHGVVMRSGTKAQKREVLSRLVESGRPDLIAQVRGALTDSDPEVRLLAYGELLRLESKLYADLQEAADRAEGDPTADGLRAAVVLAHRRLATSGVLDDAMSDWHAGEAQRMEEAIGSMVSTGAPTGTVDPEQMAAAAFRERSFAYVRAFGRALAKEGKDVPEWIRALDPEVREEVA
ncbi:MAG: hypothetical protein QNJ90_01740 [Planctomycetota bacterium]|nr:hypothetical protein [Planctomycetota bacterium]